MAFRRKSKNLNQITEKADSVTSSREERKAIKPRNVILDQAIAYEQQAKDNKQSFEQNLSETQDKFEKAQKFYYEKLDEWQEKLARAKELKKVYEKGKTTAEKNGLHEKDQLRSQKYKDLESKHAKWEKTKSDLQEYINLAENRYVQKEIMQYYERQEILANKLYNTIFSEFMRIKYVADGLHAPVLRAERNMEIAIHESDVAAHEAAYAMREFEQCSSERAAINSKLYQTNMGINKLQGEIEKANKLALEKAKELDIKIKALDGQKSNEDISVLRTKRDIIRDATQEYGQDGNKPNLEELDKRIRGLSKTNEENLQLQNNIGSQMKRLFAFETTEFCEKALIERIKKFATENKKPMPKSIREAGKSQIKPEELTMSRKKYTKEAEAAKYSFVENKSLFENALVELEYLKNSPLNATFPNDGGKKGPKAIQHFIDAKVDSIIDNMREAFECGQYYVDCERKSWFLATATLKEKKESYSKKYKEIEKIVDKHLQLVKEKNDKVLADLEVEIDNM